VAWNDPKVEVTTALTPPSLLGLKTFVTVVSSPLVAATFVPILRVTVDEASTSSAESVCVIVLVTPSDVSVVTSVVLGLTSLILDRGVVKTPSTEVLEAVARIDEEDAGDVCSEWLASLSSDRAAITTALT
jgi:hypothetical protein